MIQNLDAYCLKDYRLSHNILSKIQTQGFNNKYFSYSKKSQTKDSKPTLLYNNTKKLTKKKNKKNKKKRFQE